MRREVNRRHHHPDTAKEKPSQGEITAVGPGGRDEAGKLIPIDLKVGDHVLFGKWSGTEVKIEGVELLIMKESDIMGVLDEPVAKEGRLTGAHRLLSRPHSGCLEGPGSKLKGHYNDCEAGQILGRRSR